MRLKYCPICREEKLLDGIAFACPGCHIEWQAVWPEAKRRRAGIEAEKRRANKRLRKEKKLKEKEKAAAGAAPRTEANKTVIKAIKAIRRADEQAIADKRAKELKERYWNGKESYPPRVIRRSNPSIPDCPRNDRRLLLPETIENSAVANPLLN